MAIKPRAELFHHDANANMVFQRYTKQMACAPLQRFKSCSAGANSSQLGRMMNIIQMIIMANPKKSPCI
eukprot:scaffold220_cov169-Amphora_coffeaeformis.AAC.15